MRYAYLMTDDDEPRHVRRKADKARAKHLRQSRHAKMVRQLAAITADEIEVRS